MKQQLTLQNMYYRLLLELRTFLQLSQSLSFDSKPDYDCYYNLFDSLLLREGFHGDPTFDWDISHVPWQ